LQHWAAGILKKRNQTVPLLLTTQGCRCSGCLVAKRMIVFAYVDPGLGLLLWQAILSAFLGAVFCVKKTRNFLLEPFQKILRPAKRQILPPSAALARATNARQ
jgi:hypothetical protein